ncbi:MAG: VWA domain-containing protein [Blastocatellia bacterium]|nr:VWA domain-containing protein [Blastocatellia bacterium]
MRPKSLNPLLAAALIAAMVVSALPHTFAGTGAGYHSESQQRSRPRRGKNGSRVNDASGDRSADRDDRSDAGTDHIPEGSQPIPVDTEDKPAAAGTKEPAPTPTNRLENKKQPEAAATQSQDRTEQRRQPAPFDRPPLVSGSRTGQDSSSRTSQPSQDSAPVYTPSPRSEPPATGRARNDRRPTTNDRRAPQYDPPPATDPASNDRRRTTDDGRGTTDDTGRQPPVLNRPSESRRRSEPREEQPPVLRRPSDSRSRGEERPRNSDADYPSSDGPARDSSNQPAPDEDEPLKLNATLVNIPVLVSDRSGRYVPQLSANDFLLYEDGVQQEVAFFGNEKVPFKVALLLDVSPSVQGNMEDIQDAAMEFVQQMRSQDEIMVVSFDKQIHFLTGFTNDRRQLEYAIRSTSTGSGTSVYDAVYETVASRMRNVEGRKALILFSDGEDTTSSRASYDDAVELVTESDVLVYGLRYPGSNYRRNPWPSTRNPIPQIPFPLPIPWPIPWPRRRGGNFTASNPNMNAAADSQWRRQRGQRDFMEDITTAGGGPVYDAEQISDLRRLASRIAEELRHVYMISYYPTNALSNGGYRDVRIRVRGRSDIAVRHRRGYNAQEAGRRPGT